MAATSTVSTITAASSCLEVFTGRLETVEAELERVVYREGWLG